MIEAIPADDAAEKPLSSNAAATRMIDAELLLRETFDTDPRQGCALLFRLYYPSLCSHVIRFVYSKSIAEDIVSDVFCTFWDNRIFAKIDTSYRAYLFKSVRNSAYSYVRYELARSRQCDKSAANHSPSDPCEILQYDELYQRLDETINALPQQCKRVFMLSRMENMRYQEIADELHISVKAIEAQICKALRILRHRLN